MAKTKPETLHFDTEVEAMDYLENIDFVQSNDCADDKSRWFNEDGRTAVLSFREKASVQGSYIVSMHMPKDWGENS